MRDAGFALQVALRNMRNRAVPSLLTILVIGLAVALSITVVVLADALHQGILRATDAFGVLVIGPKGSSQQLILNTILLQDVPVGVMDASVYESLQNRDPRLVIVPIAMGDNIGGAPIIGTDQNFFLLRRNAGDPPLFALTSGRLFMTDFEAVLGAEAAGALGLKVGNTFYSSHGFGKGLAGDVHKNTPYTVVGILAPTHSAYDRAVFATTGSIWTTHEKAGENVPSQFSAPDAKPSQGDSGLDAVTAVRGKLTAALVMPFGISLGEIYKISQQVNNGNLAQAAFPGAELGNLFNLLDQGQIILNIVGWLALVMASITILLSLYGTTLARQQAIAVMRSLGARRGTVFTITLLEAVLLSVLGVLLGAALGHGVAAAISRAITERSTILIEPRIIWQEIPLLLLPIGLGTLAGLFPALMAYRLNVVDKLFAG